MLNRLYMQFGGQLKNELTAYVFLPAGVKNVEGIEDMSRKYTRSLFT